MCCCLPPVVVSDPRSEVDFWTNGRGPNTPHRSTTPPTPPAAAISPPAMSTLLLEELMLTSEFVLLNQLLHKQTNIVYNKQMIGCWCFGRVAWFELNVDYGALKRQCVCVFIPALLFWGAVWRVWRGRLGRGILPLFSDLHALDLHFLNSNNNKKKNQKIS